MEKVQKTVVSGLLQHEGKVLLICRSAREKSYPRHFELPGGKVEFGEDPVKALEREFLEETNLKIKVGEPFRTFSYVSDEGQRHSVEIVFRVSLVSSPSEIKLSDDHDEYKWVLPSEVDKITLSEEIRKSFNCIMPGLFNVAVDVLIENNGKILVCKRADDRDHAPGQWEALGGRVEQGETMEQAVRREAKEETGLDVEVVEPIYTFRFLRGTEKAEHLGVSFWCKYLGGEVTIDPHEHSQFRWATPDEALELISDESIKKAFSKLKEKLSEKIHE